MVLGGTITGIVTNSSGTGIAGIWVYAVDPVSGAGINGATTQPDEIYLVGLPTGSYKLHFYSNDTGYISQWFNNKASSDLADAVSVTAKLTTSNIDATMIQGVYITGRVINSLNTGISDVVVTVTDTANGSTYGYVTTQSDGRGRLIGLPPGSYIFTPTHQYFNFSPGNLGIAVSNSDLYLGSFFGAITVPDADEDVIPDIQDNCPAIYNPDQADMNSNGLGDACDPDADNDGIPNEQDNCPTTPNADQSDSYGVGYGDACTVVSCVASSMELQTALTAAQDNGKNDIIRLSQGTYGISGNGSNAFNYLSSDPFEMAVRGGYSVGRARTGSSTLQIRSLMVKGIDRSGYHGGVMSLDITTAAPQAENNQRKG